MQKSHPHILKSTAVLTLVILALTAWLAAPFARVFAAGEGTNTFYAKLTTADGKALSETDGAVSLETSENIANRVWQFTYNSADGSYTIVNKVSGLALTATDTGVSAQNATGTDNQKWLLYLDTTNTFSLAPVSNTAAKIAVNDNGVTLGTDAAAFTITALSAEELPVTMVTYQAHVQDVGWQNQRSDGATAGTTGKSLRVEALKVTLGDTGYTGSVIYRAHVQDVGWQSYVSDGETAGTTGKNKRLEAIQIKLTDDVAAQYDIYYRVHVQDIGWMGWAKNGASAGTENKGLRVEAIQIKLVRKGGAAPGSTANTYQKGSTKAAETTKTSATTTTAKSTTAKTTTSVTKSTVSARQKVISIAQSQLGYKEGSNNYTKYGVWYASIYGTKYGFSNAPWCAMFVSWCGNQAGLSSNTFYYHAYCPTGVSWYQNKKLWHWKSSYTPKTGDIIYYDWNGDKVVDHVGLVETVKDGNVTTIEGNYNDQVKRRTIGTNSSYIFGYASPNY